MVVLSFAPVSSAFLMICITKSFGFVIFLFAFLIIYVRTLVFVGRFVTLALAIASDIKQTITMTS